MPLIREASDIDGASTRARLQLLPDQITALLPADGVLTFLLTVALLYVTVVSIQAVRPTWADGLQILTPALFCGVAAGYLALIQRLLRPSLLHLLTLLTGALLAFQLTASAVLDGDRPQLLRNLGVWVQRSLLAQQVSDDNSVFLLFLTLLTYLLAYLTLWLVFSARRPWLALVANAAVLLINLNQSATDLFPFLIVFLVLTLLLLVRFALAEHTRLWRHTGLRFSPDLSWDFMQAGAIVAVIVALTPTLLPVAQPNQSLLTYMSSSQSPISQIQQRFQSLFGGVNGKGSGSYSFFDTSLQLVGSVYLPDTPILSYTLPNPAQSDPSQYLSTEVFANYDGIGNWQRDQAVGQEFAPNQPLPTLTSAYHLDTYRITFHVTSTGGQRYIFTPGSSAYSFGIPTDNLIGITSQEPITYESGAPLQTGSSYVVTGYVSNATSAQLASVPYPNGLNVNSYAPEIMTEYAPAGEKIDPYIVNLAHKVTQGSTSMYAAASDIETYLHSNFTYNARNPNPPNNEDATVWFLKRKEGFCTFFASAMALMGRALGMPTRIVSGYATGNYDTRSNSFVVRGTQAHAWTQIYFGQYGWINFEPTASFSPFARALPNGQIGGSQGPSTTPAPTTGPAQRGRTDRPSSSLQTPANTNNSGLINASLGLGILLFLALIAAAVLAWWWRSLFKSYSTVANGFARLTMMGIWAGVRPKRSQTPREYASELASVTPIHREAIEHVGALYSRERWGRPLDADEEASSKESYTRGREALLSVILRRARHAPARLLRVGRRFTRAGRRTGTRV